jgi:peroxiredoxin
VRGAKKMMNKRLVLRLVVLGIIFVALGSAFYTSYTSDNSLVKEGDPAPEFTLKNLEGETVKLSDFRGQGVFINFWASWCEPCKIEMPDMEKQYRLMKDQGIEIVAINIEESELAVSAFKKRMDLTFPILLDKDKSVVNSYGVGPIPSSFFIDKDGIVVAKVEGIMSERRIEYLLNSVKP